MRGAIALLFLLCLIPPRPALVAFGDSIALGIRSGGATPFTQTIAADLGLSLDNRAVSGTTVAQQLQAIAAYGGPAADAVWLVCANDLYFRTPAADFTRDVQRGVDILRARGLRVYLNAVCPAFPRKEDTSLVTQYNAALAQIQGRIPVDVSFIPPADFTDGTHPNAVGQAWLALAFERAMRRRVWVP